MNWTAIIPLKPAGERKTRLAARLSQTERLQLGGLLFAHVASVLQQVGEIGRIVLLSGAAPRDWSGDWRLDGGRGLNPELQAARAAIDGPLLVIHADLPLVVAADISALLSAAEAAGCAIAPDRHGAGTNALALHDQRAFSFGFGPGSFARHARQAGTHCHFVRRPGLALDIDTPDDLDAATEAGFEPR